MPGRRQRRLELALALAVAAGLVALLAALGPGPDEEVLITPLPAQPLEGGSHGR